MNVRLLRKVAKHISEEPKRLCMSIFADSGYAGEDYPPCGTIGCIAGWAAMLTGTPSDAIDNERSGMKALELNKPQAQRLFFTGHWPESFNRKYWSAKSSRGKVKVALARIEHFIKTKGAE